MRIEEVNAEEMRVYFDENPSAGSAQSWTDQVAHALKGSEKVARLDLHNFHQISSLMIGVVVRIFRLMEKQGGTVRVEVASEDIRKVFDVFQLTSLFDVSVRRD